jgi:hypothetical protein
MSAETFVLSIRTVGGLKVTLEIQGTILVYKRSCRAFDEEAWIPVESVELSKRRKFRGDALIVGLLVMVACVIWPLALFVTPMQGPLVERLSGIYSSTLILGGVVLLLCFIRSFKRHKTICVCFRDGHSIEFWKSGRMARQIEEFESVLRQKQRCVQEHITEMEDVAVTFTLYKSEFIRSLAMILPFCLPAVITGDARLLLLTILPILWFLYKQIALVRHPRLYKQACRHYRHRRWNQAVENLNDLLSAQPDCTPAHILLVRAHTRLGQYDQALQAVSHFPEEDCGTAEDLYSEIWRFKRLDKRRQETV